MVTSFVIVRPEHLESIRKRLADVEGVNVISESDLLPIQDTLLSRPPEILVMHSAFATTSRGATLVSGLKARPNETGTAIRVFIEDDVKPLILSETALDPHDAMLETSRPLDRAGTRQAARYPMNRRDVAVNGEAGQLIDLSVSGAQVQSAMRLRPLKLARLVLPDATGDLRLQGTVAWAIAVPSGGAIQYRAGVEFVNPDKRMLTAFCERHGIAPDPTR
ncbi:MAG: PilZ domain-containing protein [Cyanobacteria bacterium]|nr:PilZ domain-containing protein [Cyanobacteriota bacterium]